MMTAINATAEIFWTAFRALTKKERNAVIERFLKDQDFMEEIIDLAIIEQRKNEPARPLEDYLADRAQSH